MAIPAGMKEKKNAFRFIGGDFMNVAYLTGFVRNPDKKARTFQIQQTSNVETMVTIHLGEKDSMPAEQRAVTVMAHAFGETREDGSINLKLRSIDISDPNKLAMPTYLAWSGIDHKGMKAFNVAPQEVQTTDGFTPFAENGELKGAIQDTLSEDEDGFQIVQQLLEATRGRLDSRLGENANVVMITGIIEKAMIVKATDFTKEYIALLVRQHEDETKCLPVRLIPNTKVGLEVHIRDLKPGFPIKIAGQARMKLIKGGENGEEIVSRQMYIRCHEAKTPALGREIFTRKDEATGRPRLPKWFTDKSRTLLNAHNERRQKLGEVARQGNAIKPATAAAGGDLDSLT